MNTLSLHQLKRRMLHAALEVTPDAPLFKRLCGAANEAEDFGMGDGLSFAALSLPV